MPYGHLQETLCKEQVSQAYLHAVATAARCTVVPIPVDVETVDVSVHQTAPHDKLGTVQVDVQLKCTARDVVKNNHIAYSIEAKYYNELRRTDRMSDIILVVMVVPDALEDWIEGAEVEHVADAQASLTLTRLGGTRDQYRSYKVFIDGSFVGRISENQSLPYALEPGVHTVRLRMDWGASPAIEIVLNPGGTESLYCCSGSITRTDIDLFRRACYIQLGRPADGSRMLNNAAIRNRDVLLALLPVAVFTLIVVITAAVGRSFTFAFLSAALGSLVVWIIALPSRCRSLK